MSGPQLGDIIGGKYRLDGVIGEGGFGVVFRGTTEGTGRPVAVKFLKPEARDDPGKVARFRRELRTIARLESPHTVTLYDHGQTDDGDLFMVCEYVGGEDLETLLARRATLTELETCRVMYQVLKSLAEAHERGALHRDIKPSNIRVFEQDGRPLRVKVLDFGIALLLDDEEARLTHTGHSVGTPRYMAPEQVLNDPLSVATDIYGVGVVTLEMLCGRPSTTGLPPWSRDPAIPPDAGVREPLRGIVNRMLRKAPEERFASAQEVLNAIRPILKGAPLEPAAPPEPVTIERPTTTSAPPKTRYPVLLAASVALALAGIAAAVALSSSDRSENSDPVPAPQPMSPPLLRTTTPPEPADLGTQPDRGPIVESCSGLSAFEPGVHQLSNWEGLEKENVWVRIPNDYDPGRRHRAVMVLHDYVQSPAQMLEVVDSPAASQDVLIAPLEDDWNSAWNHPDTADRLKSLLSIVRSDVCLQDRLFIVGLGAGGIAANRLVCEMDDIAAIAATSYRSFPAGTICQKPRSVPFLDIHTMQDPIARADGSGCISRWASLEKHIQRHKEFHDCEGPPKTVTKHELGDCITWQCRTPYVSCEIDAGRPWRGTQKEFIARSSPFDIIRGECDSEASGYPFAARVWKFFDTVDRGSELP